MKILLTGRNGQLGQELLATRPADMDLMAPDKQALDIRDKDCVRGICEEFSPELIINCAAYTKVDQAETDSDEAYQVNYSGVHNILFAARTIGARVIHVSTDFVFDGHNSTPYLPDAPANPIGVYGKSKSLGERVLLDEYAEKTIILRTSWLYSSHGQNFVKTILRLCRQKDMLNVVSDQTGTPTWAGGLASVLWDFARRDNIHGVFHWSDSGIASWYDFACAIMEEGLAAGLLDRPVIINPIHTDDYPTAARRPAYSVLDKTATWNLLGYRGRHWRHELKNMLQATSLIKKPLQVK